MDVTTVRRAVWVGVVMIFGTRSTTARLERLEYNLDYSSAGEDLQTTIIDLSRDG